MRGQNKTTKRNRLSGYSLSWMIEKKELFL